MHLKFITGTTAVSKVVVERLVIERADNGRPGWTVTAFGDGRTEAKYVVTAYGVLGVVEQMLTPWKGQHGGKVRAAQSAVPTHPMVRP